MASHHDQPDHITALTTEREAIASALVSGIDEEVRPSWDRDVNGYDDDYGDYLRDEFDLRMRG